MKGILENDEVTAPLYYLLTPHMLSSQKARIAAYVIEKAQRYIPRFSLAKIISKCLSGTRRHAMKVTAYKQMIRMLVDRPKFKQHIRLLQREWNRDLLHRDVRLVIVSSVFKLLNMKDALTSSGRYFCWNVLTTVLEKPDSKDNLEIITPLLGVLPEN